MKERQLLSLSWKFCRRPDQLGQTLHADRESRASLMELGRISLKRMTIVKPLVLIGLISLWLSAGFAGAVWGQRGADEARFERLRKQMVQVAVVESGVTNTRVIDSMLATRRHEFMPRDVRHLAYLDAGIPIGESQTISSPFIVAYMTESLDPQPEDKVLEIGTGSGYQAAILSPLVDKVYTIEIVRPLGEQAAKTLERLNYDNVFTRVGDGFKGWPEKAPFDKIIVTCSPEKVPQPLIDQLREGGLIVVPVGERHQQTLYLMRKENGELVEEALRPTLFVPMTGQAEEKREVKPDPANPRLLNGSFEEELPENGFVPGWYYQRQLQHVEEVLAPNGSYYVQFENDTSGLPAHLMQGFAIDGRQVEQVVFSVSVMCEDVKQGNSEEELPVATIWFYDEKRERIGYSFIGPFKGTRTWGNFDREVDVPRGTREAIVRIGLFGATGKVGFDNVMVKKK